MRIGPYAFQQPIMLAPMAGFTDQPFRNLCRRFGADMVVTEMVTSKPELLGQRKSQMRLQHNDPSTPLIVQIVGNDPQQMAAAARYYADQGAQIIDINLGCPAKKVCNTQAGSALMQNPPLVARIVQAVVAAVALPVTLKTRTGWDLAHKNVLEIARIAQDNGVQSLVIHGRTRACGFKGQAEYATIAAVKAAIDLPVIVNGDITSPAQARQVLRQTQADGVMIGRGALGRPWIFQQVKQYQNTGTLPPSLSAQQQALVIQAHLQEIHHFYGERQGVQLARKHFSWYIQAHVNRQQHKKTFNALLTAQQQLDCVHHIFAHGTKEDLAA